MKRLRAHIVILWFCIIVCGCLLASCTQSSEPYKIAVAQCSKGPWREKVNQEMLAAQHLYEHDVRVSISNSYDDPLLQAHLIDSMRQTDIDLMVVAPYEDTKVINDAIDRVLKAGIPVVSFDRKTNANYTAFIGGNNVEAGYIVGEYIASMVRGTSQKIVGKRPLVMEITGLLSTTPALERHRGFEKAMKALPEAEYICRKSDWSSDSACYYATQLIDSLQRVSPERLDYTYVFCHNDGMATGVYKAVVEQDVEGRIKILGIDGMPNEGQEYVKLGHQVGSYYYPTHGEKIVRLALDILTGKPYERENPMQGFVVTPENVELVMTESNELDAQNDYLITIQNKLENFLGLYDTQRKILVGTIICIIVLVIAVIAIWYAYWQTRRTIRKRQSLNEEQTLFYTDASRRKVAEILSTSNEALPQPQSQDVLFAEQLNEAISKHLSNPNLKMDDLGEELGLGRVQLYRRVKAVTGQTPVELLRMIRLQRAYVLLCNTTKTVAEIAFEVGFNTPGYFSKCFKEQYGKLPMELRDTNDKTKQT